MHIGFLTSVNVSNALYRALGPAEALRRHGLPVEVIVGQTDVPFDPRPLHRCDVVHIYRRTDLIVRACVEELRQRGIAVTWDNDDDLRLLPPRSLEALGLTRVGAQRDFRDQSRTFLNADVVTTTSALLADRYRDGGAREVVVVENHIEPWQVVPPLRESGRFTIGWVAGLEHHADADAIGISQALRRVMERNEHVHVVTIGVRLDLDSPRYHHESFVPMAELPDRVRRFDVGIAPLGDIPMSYARSNVKVKEYAAARIPWLASPRGPYAGFGSRQGGLLVADDEWEQALQRLIDSPFARVRLRARAKAWAKSQMIDRHVDQWLDVFELAIDAAGRRATGDSLAATAAS